MLRVPLNFHGPRLSAGMVFAQLPQVLNIVCVSGIVVGSGEGTDDGRVSFPPRGYASVGLSR